MSGPEDRTAKPSEVSRANQSPDPASSPSLPTPTTTPPTGRAKVAPTGTLRSFTPEEAKSFFGSFAIGRMRFPAKQSVGWSAEETEQRRRYLVGMLSLAGSGSDTHVIAIARGIALLKIAVDWGFDPREIYAEAQGQAVDVARFPKYEELVPTS